MYEHSNLTRDSLKSEMDFRLGRIQSDIAGRRARRRLTTHREIDGLTWTKVR
jgi:hypothetical protein